MNQIIANGLNTLIIMGIILACVIIAWIIYAFIWKAWFIPIEKQIKLDKERAAINREFTKIEDKRERLEDEVDILRAEYSTTAVKNNDLELEIQRKQKLIKDYETEIKEFRAWKEKGAPKASDIPDDPEELKKLKELEKLDAKIDEANQPAKKKRISRKKNI